MSAHIFPKDSRQSRILAAQRCLGGTRGHLLQLLSLGGLQEEPLLAVTSEDLISPANLNLGGWAVICKIRLLPFLRSSMSEGKESPWKSLESNYPLPLGSILGTFREDLGTYSGR